jgi:AcrR family transcriptional regulator
MRTMPAARTPPPPLQPDRRQALVAAAYRQIAELGFEGLRTREVASAVGINVATLHYYFPTKETLITDVLKHAMQRFRSTMPGAGPGIDQLLTHFAGIRRLARDEPELFAVMGELALRSTRDPAIREIYQATTNVWRATVRGLLAKAVKDGSLSGPRHLDAQASLVVAALMGACMVPPFQPERLRDTVAELERSLGLR